MAPVIARRVREIAEERGKPIPISARIDALGFDSLDYLDFINALEDEFNVTIPNDVVINFVTIGDIVAWLERAV